MLASILGVGEEEATNRLDCAVLVTTNDNQSNVDWAAEIVAMLERTVIATADSGVETQLELIVGDARPRASCRKLYAGIDSLGATVAIDPVERKRGDAHPLFAMAAACTVAASVLSVLLDHPALPKASFPLSFDFTQLGIPSAALGQQIDIGDSVLIGAGAIAHGFLRALRHLRVHGKLQVVDPKTVGEGILNRCLYLEPDDVGLNKAEILVARAQKEFRDLELTSSVEVFRDYVKQNGAPATAIVTVDSRRARRSIQSELPGRVLDASTTNVKAVVVHSHRQPNRHACLACIYRHVPDEYARERAIADGLGVSLETVQSGFISAGAAVCISGKYPQIDPAAIINTAFDSLFRQLCAEQALVTPEGRQVLAPFAFVSNLAGALLVIEFLRSEAGLATTNYWQVDPWRPPIGQTRRLRTRIPECEICSRPEFDAIIEESWGMKAAK